MLLNKVLFAGAVLLVLAIVSTGTSLLLLPALAQEQPEAANKAAERFPSEETPPTPQAEKKPQPLPKPGPAKTLITKETQQTIDAGLAYLAAQQAADGSWGNEPVQGNLGVVGLAGRAFLAGGHQPGKGKYGETLTKAIEFVLSQENKALPGYLYNPQMANHGTMYGHGFALLFLAEAPGRLPTKS